MGRIIGTEPRDLPWRQAVAKLDGVAGVIIKAQQTPVVGDDEQPVRACGRRRHRLAERIGNPKREGMRLKIRAALAPTAVYAGALTVGLPGRMSSKASCAADTGRCWCSAHQLKRNCPSRVTVAR